MMLVLWLFACSPSLDSARPISYDHDVCDECGMLISDPTFAAELVTTDGRVDTFDDPACALRYIARAEPHLAHIWFVDSTDTSLWLDWRSVAFLPADGAPMDGGFRAVPMGSEGSVSFSEVSNVVLGGKP